MLNRKHFIKSLYEIHISLSKKVNIKEAVKKHFRKEVLDCV